MAIPGIIKQQDFEKFYGVSRTTAHEIWLKFLKFINKGDDHIPTKAEFAAFTGIDIAEINFYLYAEKQDVIDVYEHFTEVKLKLFYEHKKPTPTALPSAPSDLEKEVDKIYKLKLTKEN